MLEPEKKERRQFRSELSMPRLAASALLLGRKHLAIRQKRESARARGFQWTVDPVVVLSPLRSARPRIASLHRAQSSQRRLESCSAHSRVQITYRRAAPKTHACGW